MDDTVGEIAGMVDPVLRNLCITQRYHEFAIALRDAGCGTDATWCAFAVWASKTAGATIRGEVLPGRAKALVLDDDSTQAALDRTNQGLAGKAVRKLSHDHLGRIIDSVTSDVSSQIATGNVLVFRELAPIFSAWCRAWARTRSPQGPWPPHGTGPVRARERHRGSGCRYRLRRLCTRARSPAANGPPWFWTATFWRSRTNSAACSPRSGALNAAISDTLKNLIETDIIRHVPGEGARHALDELTDTLCSVLDQAWDTALTESIMRLVTSREALTFVRTSLRCRMGCFHPHWPTSKGPRPGPRTPSGTRPTAPENLPGPTTGRCWTSA